MATLDEEEDRLRSVTLQNARSILLARQRAEEELRKQSEWLRVTLASIGDAVISTDAEGRVTFMNGVAEALTGWPNSEAVGHPLPDVFHIINEQTRQLVENPALRALQDGAVIGLANHTLLIARDGTERPIDDSAAPIRDDSGSRVGAVLVFRDVTERRRAEMALRHKEAEVTDFIENATIGLHWVGPDGIILWANKAELALLGFTAEEYIGRHIAEFHVDRSIIDDILRRLLNKEVIQAYETQLRCKDGSLKHVLINSNGLWEGERFIHTRCFTHDITDRKRADEAQARLAAIVESSEDAIVSKSLDGIIRSWNAGAEHLFGYTPAEAVGQSITLIIPPELQEEERMILARLCRGERVEHFETIRVAKDGRRFHISLTISPVRNGAGQVIGASKVARDITERKRAEEALRESEERSRRSAAAAAQAAAANAKFRAFFEQGTNFAGVLTLDGTLVEANRLSLVACGFSREDVIGKPFWECGWWNRSPVVMDIVRAGVQQAAGNMSFRKETTYYLADGSERAVDLSLAPVKDEAGCVLFVAATGTDITARKAMEEALLDADRKKDDFIALLAHELRNPLAPLRNGLQVMQLAASNAEALAESRDMMERQLSHMVRLIDDLLDISRIGRNKMELRRTRVLLADAISNAVETARPLIEEAGHELTVSLPAAPIHLDADLTRLAQVFSNLLTNSAKYTEPGGRIWLSAERVGNEVVVSVRDSGIGIPAESLNNIFDMFSQVDRSIERSTGGLGIGLALVKGLIEMHGGTVVAASDGPGRGSEFTVRLPVLARVLPVEKITEVPRIGPGRRILVVDDNLDARRSLGILLRLQGNEVRTAQDGVEAVEAAEEFKPEVVLMDVGMPRLNGLDATRRIREQAWGKDMIVIALTGWGQEGDRLLSREAGCNAHLVKPVILADLNRLLEDLSAGKTPDA